MTGHGQGDRIHREKVWEEKGGEQTAKTKAGQYTSKGERRLGEGGRDSEFL